ncbi:DegV family protein [Vallitalea okinawensis]|uniref:DegV family protein n=1 Tax=Vallitalea okinawensis TaxID=2078660 RepID=UPI000CFC381F|nr:DegV family protein [Vallitalea okinawensis]
MDIQLVMDSTADLLPELVKKYQIDVLPLRVLIEDTEYVDGETITTEQVYDYMKQGIFPKTSQVSIERIMNCFDTHLKKGKDLIYIAFSSQLSGTYQTAVMVAEEMKEKYSDRKITVIDSKGGAAATGLTVLQAALMKEAKRTYEDIIDNVKYLSSHVEHIFTLASLEWLYKGGRLSKGQAIIGDMLKIKPILHVKDGKIGFYKKVRGRNKSLKSIVEEVTRRMGSFNDQIIAISHAGDLETANKVKHLIQEATGISKFMINNIGPTLGTHLGIGGVGVLFYNEKPDKYYDEPSLS